ncbi:MAG: flagellin N-terminal helical domain-containing protein [Leptospirales bacterium]
MIRVTGLMTNREVVDAHDRATDNLYLVDRQVSSGKRFETPGDAPERMGEALRINRNLAVTHRIIENAREGSSRLQLMESILGQVGKLLIRAKGEAIRMANDTMTGGDRRIGAQEMMRTLEQIVSLANTKAGEQYLFSGTNVTKPPFRFTDPSLRPGEVTYQGNHTTAYVQQGFSPRLSESGLMGVTEAGDRVLGNSATDPGGHTPLPVLLRFVQALVHNDQPAITRSIDELDRNVRDVSERAAVLGTRERAMRTTIDRLEKYDISQKTLRSQNEDVDIPKAVSKLALNQNLLALSTKASRDILRNTQNVLFS